VIKKALQTTLQDLLDLNPALWVQVVGMSASISFGVLVFSNHHTMHSKYVIALIVLIELLIVLFSVATFSVYLTKRGVAQADKLGLRKTLGATGWNLFLEISSQTTLLIVISMVLSIGILDVCMLMAGLSFENILQSIGVVEYSILLLAVFLISEGTLFIIQGIALAPKMKTDYNETTVFEKSWFLKLANLLFRISFILLVLVSILLIGFALFFVHIIGVKILLILHLGVLGFWYFYNRRNLY
jgi:hypothetical protein